MSDPQFPASGLCAYITYRDLDWPSSGSDHPEPAFFFPLHRQIYAQTTILPSSSSFPFLVFSSLSLSLFSTYIYTLSLSHSTVLPHYPTDRRHPSPPGHFGRGLGLLVQFRPWGFYYHLDGRKNGESCSFPPMAVDRNEMLMVCLAVGGIPGPTRWNVVTGVPGMTGGDGLLLLSLSVLL